MSFLFGPVPSRRLGLSLGIDLVPFKTCSLDCIYCECGKTTNLTSELKSYFNVNDILKEIDEKIPKIKKLDYITFSGSGEPTLSNDIGIIIDYLKKNFNYPVVVLTNGTLLFNEKVKNNLLNADIIIPSLDCISKNIFDKINRPENSLDLNKIINGLIDFSKIYKGKIWLEILFVKGVNDSDDEINKLIKVIKNIEYEKIQLNTNQRPGTEKDIQELSIEEMLNIKDTFLKNNLKNIEICSKFNRKNIDELEIENLKSIIERRPMTIEDIINLTGKRKVEILKLIETIENIQVLNQNNNIYYKLIL